MIVAKTNLKKIPETCNKCKFSNYNRIFNMRYCSLLNNKKCRKAIAGSGNWVYVRLPECPLININNIS